jgi:hypothetical protein
MLDQEYTVEFEGKTYVQKHGSPFDRGSADSYYHRPPSPHKYPNGTGNLPRVEELTEEEIQAYNAGYQFNERFGEKKEY